MGRVSTDLAFVCYVSRAYVSRRVCFQGSTTGEHRPGHHHRQRDAGPVLRARRIHGQRRTGNKHAVQREEAEVTGQQETEEIRH